jgi:hypothetical protein
LTENSGDETGDNDSEMGDTLFTGDTLWKWECHPLKSLNVSSLRVLGDTLPPDFENSIHTYARELFFFQKKSSCA